MSVGTVWENGSGPKPDVGSIRPGLTHSLDYSKEGLAVNATRTCSVDGCPKPPRRPSGGMCEMHYSRLLRTGSPGPVGMLVHRAASFWDYVVPTGFCWEWTGDITQSGYGRISRDHRDFLAHRFVYEQLVGPIPDGMSLDHLCRNTICVNPDHLEPVTQAVNTQRGRAGDLREKSPTCIHGHQKANGRCRECRLIQTHRYRGKQCTVEHPCHAVMSVMDQGETA